MNDDSSSIIPSRKQCLLLFDRFQLPTQKRIHVEEVTRLALFFTHKLQEQGIEINKPLVEAAALLHDIDKNAPKKAGERHPDTAVRILNDLGFAEVAEVVKRHSLHTILDPEFAPRTWEEKVVFLADKMTKYEVIGVDHRFKLWYKEGLPQEAVAQLDMALPKVKLLEKEVYQAAGIIFADIRNELVSNP